jgi:HipA-like C-terminal domain
MPELLPHLLAGSRTSSDLIDVFGGQRVALKRAFDKDAGRVLRLGRARATRYAARRTMPGLSADEFPVFRVSAAGKIMPAGTLITLEADESVWLPNEAIVDGLPAEIEDIAPRGFLGRSFARRHAELGLPNDLRAWSDNHVLQAISRRGEDLPGNLVVGRESFDRFHKLQYDEVRERDFPARAMAALAGEHAGSSAGGEQPKFTALVEGQHRIIKFATNESDNSRRWQDLLALEHAALQTLTDAGIGAAETRLKDIGGMRFLIITRFDRVAVRGRRAVLSLSAASGRADVSWADAAHEMLKSKLLDAMAFRRIALLDAFGAQIANTDRHSYNVSLFPREQGFDVAPAYDQLPMAYAPPASGHLRMKPADAAVPAINTLDAWDEATLLASEFWRRAAKLQLTDAMRAIVEQHVQRL